MCSSASILKRCRDAALEAELLWELLPLSSLLEVGLKDLWCHLHVKQQLGVSGYPLKGLCHPWHWGLWESSESSQGFVLLALFKPKPHEQSPNCTTDKRQQPEKYCTWISMQTAFLPAGVTPSLKTCEYKVGWNKNSMNVSLKFIWLINGGFYNNFCLQVEYCSLVSLPVKVVEMSPLMLQLFWNGDIKTTGHEIIS